MTLTEKQLALSRELTAIKDAQRRFAHVIARGGGREPLGAEYKTEEFKVGGCLANLWFVPAFVNGRCHFQCDSDSAIVRGVAGLICDFYSGHPPEEILGASTEFLRAAGISQHLSQNRRNGLGRLEERIKAFARAHAGPPSA